ncbi:MAG: hypothetical protein IKV40_07525, partial [Clostridia bacterium]|nr:hypothetical protein [Clostridia bacterium]
FNLIDILARGALRKDVRLSYILLRASCIASQFYDASHRYIVLRTVLTVLVCPTFSKGEITLDVTETMQIPTEDNALPDIDYDYDKEVSL